MPYLPAQAVTAGPQAASRQGGGQALPSPYGEQIAQLEGLANEGSAALAAQRGHMAAIDASPRQAMQRQAMSAIGRAPNRTGMPDQLKAGIENLSGMALDHVKVHYNSPQPAQMQAHAFAQGADIHVAPGQEQHLPHEAWHVVQQAQGRVQPTTRMGGAAVNDDAGLEAEADSMGQRALSAAPAQRMAAGQTVHQLAPIMQFGGTEWSAHHAREHIEKLGTQSGITAHYTKGDDGNFYIEGWITTEGVGECAGEVQIVPGQIVTLHTKSSEGARGGLGDKLMPLALKTIAKNHSDGTKVLLPMGGGAVVKLLIGKLSEVFGVPEIHKLAKDARQERVEAQKQELAAAETKEEKDAILARRKANVSEFNPDFLLEHGLHLNALLASDKGQRIDIISKVYVKIEPQDDSEMSIQDHLKRVVEAPAMQVILPMDLFVEFANAM